MGRTVAYVRASTDKQVDDHQRRSINDWCEENGRTVDSWFVDIGSGASDSREQFNDLLDAVESGDVDDVVVWEISRISRKGATLQQFFDLCEETGTTVVITDGAVEKVTPDGQGRFVADIIGMVYQEERRTLIRRIESGVSRARDEGKWLGQVPVGFERDSDGYLTPLLNPDRDAGEVGYLEIRDALARIEDGESYRKAARGINTTRQTLSSIHQDEDRRAWYVDAGSVDDDRVRRAVEQLDG